jgi:TRAP-type C4-dicarboxylate transport system permease small subunit
MAFISLIAVAWIYVVMLMAITEATQTSIIAGIMTFIFYCVLPLGIVLYILRSPQRKRKLREQGELNHLINKTKDTNENPNESANKSEDEK